MVSPRACHVLYTGACPRGCWRCCRAGAVAVPVIPTRRNLTPARNAGVRASMASKPMARASAHLRVVERTVPQGRRLFPRRPRTEEHVALCVCRARKRGEVRDREVRNWSRMAQWRGEAARVGPSVCSPSLTHHGVRFVLSVPFRSRPSFKWRRTLPISPPTLPNAHRPRQRRPHPHVYRISSRSCPDAVRTLHACCTLSSHASKVRVTASCVVIPQIRSTRE
ncbi:hypothetical protein F5148DRAFT_367876 [Russula earlei]|uniref:Uncharacterized protein n=1 Tax=Russula earlei TaxID=71964 RepID=A0ACC0U1Q0_9AGAM|nr:hypothetical protein F5148DRAFT_367876 [Russula earlei]